MAGMIKIDGVPTIFRRESSFFPAQCEILEEAFNENPFLPKGRADELAEDAGLGKSQVQSWFQRNRKKAGVQPKRKKQRTGPAPGEDHHEAKRSSSHMVSLSSPIEIANWLMQEALNRDPDEWNMYVYSRFVSYGMHEVGGVACFLDDYVLRLWRTR